MIARAQYRDIILKLFSHSAVVKRVDVLGAVKVCPARRACARACAASGNGWARRPPQDAIGEDIPQGAYARVMKELAVSNKSGQWALKSGELVSGDT